MHHRVPTGWRERRAVRWSLPGSAQLVIGALFAGLSGSQAVAGQLAFTNATSTCGVTPVVSDWEALYFEYPPFTVVFKGGGAVGDFNNDGFQDLFVVPGANGSNAPDQLYINNGDGTFTERGAEWGVNYAHFGAGAAVGDFDGDGWLDLFVLSWGPLTGDPIPGDHRLYRNNGNGTFTNVAVQAGVNHTGGTPDGYGAAFGDYDLDGDLDLAVSGYYSPFYEDGGASRLFRNNGDGTFTDVTKTAILYDISQARGYSSAFADMDGDGYPELLWVADFWTSKYLINNGNGTFSEATAAAGVGLDSNGMGCAVGDFNNDGKLDWYVTSIHGGAPTASGNMLYMNQGSHHYVEQSIPAGVNDGGWGWGTVPVDIDHDTNLDIIATNGFFQALWQHDTTRVFLSRGDGTFADVAAQVGLIHDGQGRGMARFDVDNDGDQDIVIFGMDLSAQLFRNDLSGPDTHWLRMFFDSSAAPGLAPNGYGTRVWAKVGEQTMMRYVDGGCHYQAVSELSAHFGLGSHTKVQPLTIRWANGKQTQIAEVNADQHIVVHYLPADLDGDCKVGQADLGLLLSGYGCKPPTSPCLGDLNGDGKTDQADLGLLLSKYDKTCISGL
jgi:hypothetical protein